MGRAPAVLASDASSPSGSRGSAVDFGRITPTSTAFSVRTDNSVRFSSAKFVSFVRFRGSDSARCAGTKLRSARKAFRERILGLETIASHRLGNETSGEQL